MNAAGFAGQIGHAHAARKISRGLYCTLDVSLLTTGRLGLTTGLPPTQAPNHLGQFWQLFNQAPRLQNGLPTGAAQQAGQQVPAVVVGQVGHLPKRCRQLVHHPAAISPVGGKRVDGHPGGLRDARATILIIDDEIEMKQRTHQHRIGQRRFALAMARQFELFEHRHQRRRQRVAGPAPSRRIGQRALRETDT